MKKQSYLILLFSAVIIGSVLLMNQNIAHSQDLEPMPENITLRIGQVYINKDVNIFFSFCGVEGNFFGAGPNAVRVGHMMTIITGDIVGTDQVSLLLFQEGDSIFFREFEYKVTILDDGYVFLVKQ